MIVTKPITAAVSPTLTVMNGMSKPVPRNVRKSKAKAVELPLHLSCLEQAEICQEQARDAARLKRFKAALGLFSTASALCRRAVSSQGADDSTRAIAHDRLRQIDMEMAMYNELLRTIEKA